jgi:transposase-like protein
MEFEMVCPRCEQDYLRTFALPESGDSGLVCDECDALWLAGVDFPYPGWADRSTYMEERDLGRGDLVIGPKTGEDPPPEGVNIRRRVQPRWSGQASLYVIGHMGTPHTPCAYCPEGNVVKARLRGREDLFYYCPNCEAVWPTTESVAEQPPTFLDPYLASRNADWTEVEKVAESAD